MPFTKGKSGNPGGKKAGTKNRESEIKELFIDAVLYSVKKLGGREWMLAFAKQYPEEFARMMAKFVSTIMGRKIELTGLDGEPIQSKVEVIFVNSKDTG